MASTSKGVLTLTVCYNIWLLFAVASGSVVTPGLQIRLSQPGLNYAAGVAVDVLAKSVGQLKIPDQHGSSNLPVGKVSYDVTNIRVSLSTIAIFSLKRNNCRWFSLPQ